MRELVEIIVKAIVDEPEAVNVTETEDEQLVILKLSVAPDDMGKVIGKQGRIARAIRTVVKAMATKKGKRVDLEIV
ncbi:MAG: KH domain-containing protein [Firmicutes bacterium]|nr:KH domain-containing protein [Bacillota bacterium]